MSLKEKVKMKVRCDKCGCKFETFVVMPKGKNLCPKCQKKEEECLSRTLMKECGCYPK